MSAAPAPSVGTGVTGRSADTSNDFSQTKMGRCPASLKAASSASSSVAVHICGGGKGGACDLRAEIFSTLLLTTRVGCVQ